MQQGQCFSCERWVWTMDPNHVLIPLPTCREGYLFCANNQLAKIGVCNKCEDQLKAGDTQMMKQCLKVFKKSFNGNPDLKKPVRYENSKDHWYAKGVWIPVPWEMANPTAAKDGIRQHWLAFQSDKIQPETTLVFSGYAKGATDFYEYLMERKFGL